MATLNFTTKPLALHNVCKEGLWDWSNDGSMMIPNPDDPQPVVLQNRDIALMLKRISNDSGFWLNREL
ncbi:unnamed protein product [Ambrosiozyma monospora]|uniref:Unnamed protein product n=1 Tax=Ambrosiozyma monospora TaxID=43982 RepID=A0A9W7DKY7_AMBMO|nr:unnamed protein product [Ambrosiozyma monospora]